MRGGGPDKSAVAIAEKQLYSSHYFQTALDLSFCIRDDQDPKKPGFYLIKAMGSEQAGLTGFKGSIVRRVAVDRSVSSLENRWRLSRPPWRVKVVSESGRTEISAPLMVPCTDGGNHKH